QEVVDDDDVHDMRVASRRLRAALQLFDRKKQLRHANDATRALGDALGEVRELQVQLVWLRDTLAKASEEDRPGVLSLLGERGAQLPQRIARLQAALINWRDAGVPTVKAALAALELDGRLGGNRVRRRLSQRIKGTKQHVAATLKSIDARTA